MVHYIQDTSDRTIPPLLSMLTGQSMSHFNIKTLFPGAGIPVIMIKGL